MKKINLLSKAVVVAFTVMILTAFAVIATVAETDSHISEGDEALTYSTTETTALIIEETEAVETPQIVIKSTIAPVGEKLELTVSLENNPGVAALNLYFTYPEGFTLIEAENELSSHGFAYDKTMFWDNTDDYAEDGNLVKLTFAISEDIQEGSYEISAVVIEAYNENLDPVTFSVVNGKIEVFDFMYGDVFEDYTVNGKDVIMIRKHIAARNPTTGVSTVEVGRGSDCNGDGETNGKDVILLRKYIAGKDPLTGESSIVLGPAFEEDDDAGDTPAEDGDSSVDIDKEAVKNKQIEALSEIKTIESDFNRNISDYEPETSVDIATALAKAQISISYAETEDAVNKAMDELHTTLASCKTYALKLYDYYTALLGNINGDEKELVDEVYEFLKVIDEAYKDLDEDEKCEKLAYSVSNSVSLDVYNSVISLCQISLDLCNDADVDLVNAKGRVVCYCFPSLTEFEVLASNLDDRIHSLLGENFDQSDFELIAEIEEQIERLFMNYEDYVESAQILGGEKLVNLVTNADTLLAAWEAINAPATPLDAEDAFECLNGKRKDGLYYYDELMTKTGLRFFDYDDDEVLYEDYYRGIDSALEAWISEYNLSDEEVTDIIGIDRYNQYLFDKHQVALISDAYVKFENEIVPAIKRLNAITNVSLEAVDEYKAIRNAISDLIILQNADISNDNALLQNEIRLDPNTFIQFIEQSEILSMRDLDIEWIKSLDEDDIVEANAIRLASFMGKNTSIEDILCSGYFVELFTFSEDIKQLEKENYFAPDSHDGYFMVEYGVEAGSRRSGDIYRFFARDVATAQATAHKINRVIEKLVNLVEENKLDSDRSFIDLDGKYINLTNPFIDSSFVFEDENGNIIKAGDDAYISNEDLFGLDYKYIESDFYVTVQGYSVLTIDYFNHRYPVFKELINMDDFEDAWAKFEEQYNS